MQNPPTALTRSCSVPSTNSLDDSMQPPSYPDLPLAASNKLPQSPPTVTDGICNYNMPADSTLARFVWVVEQFVAQVRWMLVLCAPAMRWL